MTHTSLLTDTPRMKEAIEVLDAFKHDEDSFYYWLGKMELKDAEKGYLVIYFDLDRRTIDTDVNNNRRG